MGKSALKHVLGQIAAASSELRQCVPTQLDWPKRATATAKLLVPMLHRDGPRLKQRVEDILNAATRLRLLWSELHTRVTMSADDISEFNRLLKLDDVLRESITGEIVSNVVSRFLLDENPNLSSNGRSDYPDLFLKTVDYSKLPLFGRKRSKSDEFGASLKGAGKRPVRVPDGLEIKTCRDQLRVDCHHPHAGLHLAIVFSQANRLYVVEDIRIAFLSTADYRESNRNTTATTVKYSFNSEPFISLLESP